VSSVASAYVIKTTVLQGQLKCYCRRNRKVFSS